MQWPKIYLIPTHLSPSELHHYEETIPTLTYDINEAEVILGNITRPERAQFELRHRKLVTKEIESTFTAQRDVADRDALVDYNPGAEASENVVRVVKLAWFADSAAKGSPLPLRNYVIYEGLRVPETGKPLKDLRHVTSQSQQGGSSIYAQTGVTSQGSLPHRRPIYGHSSGHAPPLKIQQSTASQETDENLPPLPPFLKSTYSCQRPTHRNSPNNAFVDELRKIKTIRVLLGDQIGVRAYSTSVAAILAYPRKLQSAREVSRLPGCGVKLGELFQEWSENGKLQEAIAFDTDPQILVLRLFYDIWGVGDTTAREFYSKGLRDLDDVVEFRWESLTRVQQIGVKFYDDFKEKIPRAEVQSIAAVILEHACQIHAGCQLTIVGGYRRGEAQIGDVDVIVTHVEEAATANLVERLVMSLESAGYITHTLLLSTKNSERGQTPVNWKGNDGKRSGFDTLDKAMLVWRDPVECGSQVPRIHRRVDIVISPYKTVGCALLGWSGGTTFQRDLRRYCKKEKNLKFDSSGIRSRATGVWVDLEGGASGRAPDMETAERRVFQGLGLEWRPPEERCTG